VLLRAIQEDLVGELRAIDRYLRAIAREDDPAVRRMVACIVALKKAHALELGEIASRLGERHLERLLDQALEETFPASDPPAPALDAFTPPVSR
jgi:hypothetical protein